MRRPRGVGAQSVPLKWQKYLLLLRFDLLEASELRSNIRRYAWGCLSDFFEDLRDECAVAAAGLETYLYVIKLVPFDGVGQLPNFRLTVRPGSGQTDLDTSFKELEVFIRRNSWRPDEVWWCRTDVSAKHASVAGRMAIQTGGSSVGQIIEHVSRASPRLIETLRRGDASVFYVRARRATWGFHWRAEEVVCPQEASREEETHQFRTTCAGLEALRDRIVTFCEQLEEVGMRSYSLEYKHVSGSLSIIDWDTQDDRAVLARLIG